MPELAGAYYRDDFAPLRDAGLVQIVDGNTEITTGVGTQLTGGHTRGHQIVRIESADDSGVVLADICPTTAHLPTFWTMAYDQFPLDVRHVKPGIMNDIVDHNRLALFSHDPHVLAARLSRGTRGELSAKPTGMR